MGYRSLGCRILLAVAFVSLALYLWLAGWITPLRFEATRNDPYVDWVIRDWVQAGEKVIYHRRRVGWSRWALDGRFIVYGTNSHKLVEGDYRRGEWNGLVTSWWTNGNLAVVQFYDRGRPSGVTTSWWPNGQMAGVQPYANGSEFGTATYWDEDGNKVAEIPFAMGTRKGLEKHWSSNGALYLVCEWDNGKPAKLEFYENGNLVKAITGKTAEEYVRQHATDPLSKTKETP